LDEWWNVMTTLCHQLFIRQEAMCMKKLSSMHIAETRCACLARGMMLNSGIHTIPPAFKRPRNGLLTLSLPPCKCYKGDWYQPVWNTLLDACCTRPGYQFVVTNSVASIIYREDVIACAFAGVRPRDFFCMVALRNCNLLPVRVYGNREDAAMYQSVLAYTCIMDIMHMDGSLPDYMDRQGAQGDDLANLLGIGDWLDVRGNQEWVWDWVFEKKRGIEGDPCHGGVDAS